MHKIILSRALYLKDPYSNNLQVSAENINLMGLGFSKTLTAIATSRIFNILMCLEKEKIYELYECS